jgi:hypothetical protein
MAKIGKQLTALDTDTVNIAANDGFVVNGTGTMSIRLQADAATATAYLLAGVHYSWDIADFELADAEATTVIWIIRGMNQ